MIGGICPHQVIDHFACYRHYAASSTSLKTRENHLGMAARRPASPASSYFCWSYCWYLPGVDIKLSKNNSFLGDLFGSCLRTTFLKLKAQGKCNQTLDAGIERRLPLSSPRLSKRLNWLKRPRLSKRQSCRRPKYVDRPAAVDTTRKRRRLTWQNPSPAIFKRSTPKSRAQARID